MTGADVLADTNAVIAWTKQDEDLARVSVAYHRPAISLITLGELYFGALKSAKPDQTTKAIDATRAAFYLLFPGERSAQIYAEVRWSLRRKGRPIPENDLWIAALALEHDIPLLTRDAHFVEVNGLRVVSW